MADLAKRLAGPLYLTNVAATLYTVPAATVTVVRNIHVANPAYNTSAAFSLSIGQVSASLANYIYYSQPAPAGGAFDWSGFLVLQAGEVLQGLAGNTNILSMTISGIEVS